MKRDKLQKNSWTAEPSTRNNRAIAVARDGKTEKSLRYYFVALVIVLSAALIIASVRMAERAFAAEDLSEENNVEITTESLEKAVVNLKIYINGKRLGRKGFTVSGYMNGEQETFVYVPIKKLAKTVGIKYSQKKGKAILSPTESKKIKFSAGSDVYNFETNEGETSYKQTCYYGQSFVKNKILYIPFNVIEDYAAYLGFDIEAVLNDGRLDIELSPRPANMGGWGDNTAGGRPSYTTEDINSGKLGDTITFNSISDGVIGHEKNFVAVKSANRDSWYANGMKVKDGERYTIRLYVHNNSPLGEQKVAEDVTLSFSLPTTVGKFHNIIGYIDCSNASPTRYWDGVSMYSDKDFYIEYVEDSAVYINENGTFELPNEVIVSGGAKIGYDTLDGKIPGGIKYSGVATIDVIVHEASPIKVKLQARIKGDKEWGDSVNAKIGDEIEYQIEYRNLSGDTASNVMIRDVLPTNMEYVEGSTILYNSSLQEGAILDTNSIVTDGINIGNYSSKGNAYVRFTARVKNVYLEDGEIYQLVNWSSATVNGEVAKDNAVVVVDLT